MSFDPMFLFQIFPVFLYALLLYKKPGLGTLLIFIYALFNTVFLDYLNDNNYFWTEMSTFFAYSGFFFNVIFVLFIYEMITGKNSAFLLRKKFLRIIYPVYTLIPILLLVAIMWALVFGGSDWNGNAGLWAFIITQGLVIVYFILLAPWALSYFFKEKIQNQ